MTLALSNKCNCTSSRTGAVSSFMIISAQYNRSVYHIIFHITCITCLEVLTDYLLLDCRHAVNRYLNTIYYIHRSVLLFAIRPSRDNLVAVASPPWSAVKDYNNYFVDTWSICCLKVLLCTTGVRIQFCPFKWSLSSYWLFNNLGSLSGGSLSIRLSYWLFNNLGSLSGGSVSIRDWPFSNI